MSGSVIKFGEKFNWGVLSLEFLNKLKEILELTNKQDLGICWKNNELWIFIGWK